MDYTSMAREFMQVMHLMRKRRTQKQLNESMQGESFVLNYISHHEGNVIPSDISNAMGITSARIAATLNSLEGKGLITRRIDAQDRRKIIIDLTEDGREQVEKQHEMIMKMTTGMLEYLGEDDTKELIRIMKKLSERDPEDFM